MAPTIIQSRRRCVLGGLGVLASPLFSRKRLAAESLELSVIVHPSNSAKLTKDDLAFIFKTSKRHWSGGDRIAAFNLPPRSNERMLFDQVVLGFDADEAARYWIDRKIRGGEPPPRVVPDATLVVRLVAQMKNSIGYVPSAILTENVRLVARVRPGGVVGATNTAIQGTL